MKLNIGVICDTLKITPDCVCGEANHLLVLNDIRFLPAENNRCGNETLYFDNWENIKKHSGGYPEYLICVGGNEDAAQLFARENICGIIFPPVDVQCLFSDIQSIFLKYNQMEYDLMEALIQSKPTRDILNCCAEFFQNHVLLFDSLLNLIEYSSNYMPDDTDEDWKETLEVSKISMRLFNEIRRITLTREPTTSFTTEYFDMSPSFSNRMSRSFYHNSRKIGNISVSESGQNLTVSKTKVLDHIASLLNSTFIRRYASLFDSMENLRTLFTGMLSGVESDIQTVERTLKLVNWHTDDNYCLLSINIPIISNDMSKMFRYLYEYENIFPDCVGFIFLDSILLLIHNDNETMVDKYISKLERLLITHDALCGVSIPFCSIHKISYQYLNARLAIQLGNKDVRIRYLKDCLDEHLIRLLAGATSITPFCHRAAIKILEYDKENSTALLMSLEVYLRQNRSLQAAAAELFIHRNTLTYRLRCIKNLVKMDFENSNERLHVLLSCMVLRIMGAA